MKRKSFILGIMLAALFIAIPAYAYGPLHPAPGYRYEHGAPITVHVDGKYVSTDTAPYIKSSRTYLPLRAASESMGAKVNWNGNTRTATVTKGNRNIQCTVGSKRFIVNGQTRYFDVAPQAVNSRIMLPIRPIVDALGYKISWDGYNQDANIYTGGPVQKKPALTNIPYEVRWLAQKYYVPNTKQGIGSWINSQGPNKKFFLFISETPSGQRNVITIRYDKTITYDGGCHVYVHKNNKLVRTSDGFQMSVSNNLFTNLVYGYGAGWGGSGPAGVYDTLYKYKYVGQDILNYSSFSYYDGKTYRLNDYYSKL